MTEFKKLNLQFEQSISKSTAFLYKSQLPYGEFRTYASSDKTMASNCVFDSSPFGTALILYSISFVDNVKVKEMTEKALRFFVEEMEDRGIWRYWTSRNDNRIPPDLDDISCVSYVLKKNKVPFPSNVDIILANRNEQGIFRTWLVDFITLIASPKWATWSNQVDCVVNANVLFYLGENDETRKAINYLNDIIKNNEEDSCSQHYLDKLSFYYMLSRAYFNGVSSLSISQGRIIDRVISMQQKDGSFGNGLKTALAICTLLNFGFQNPGMDKAIERILRTQMGNGSWERAAFYLGPAPYYGSGELTTAFCIEALVRYRLLMKL